MTDKSMPNSWNHIKQYSRGMNEQDKTLRAYTYSPDCIAIQIRCERKYATAILSDAQARLFVQMILDAIEGHGKLNEARHELIAE